MYTTNENFAKHQICINALVKSGFKKSSRNVVEHENTKYIVRAHRMPKTHKGIAIIADLYELSDDKCNNIIFIDPDKYNNTIYLIDRTKLTEFIRVKGNDRPVMWLSDKNGNPCNMGMSSCMTIPISSFRESNWIKSMEIE